MGKGGKSGGNSRQRDMDDDKGGPTKVQLKGLAWNKDAAQPAFLRNAMSALAGPKPKAPEWDGTGRPPVPERPDGDEEEERQAEESEEDEWDMGRGEEAPAVVVLKEGRHLDREEVDRMRAEAKSGSAPDPLASSSAPPPKTKGVGSLAFSSGTGSKRKAVAGDAGAAEWDSVVKRSRVDVEAKQAADEKSKVDIAKDKEKALKQKRKEKKAAQKKVGLLSFGDE
ncbi:hypothetical protein RQP46_007782 [Phenoliferia psychrophenolica]